MATYRVTYKKLYSDGTYKGTESTTTITANSEAEAREKFRKTQSKDHHIFRVEQS